MDDNDAKYCNEHTKFLEENSEDITKLLWQQLIVVKSLLGTINDTLADMECKQEKVEKGLIQIESFSESVMSENQEKFNLVVAKITAEGHIAKVREAVNMLQYPLDILLEIKINTKKWMMLPP